MPRPTVAPSDVAVALLTESEVTWKRPFVLAVPLSPPATVSPETLAFVELPLNDSAPIPTKVVSAFASILLSALIVIEPSPVTAPLSFAVTEPATSAVREDEAGRDSADRAAVDAG